MSAPPSSGLAAVLFAPCGVVLRPDGSACRCPFGSRGTGAAGVAAHFAGEARGPSPVIYFALSRVLGGRGSLFLFLFLFLCTEIN